MPASGQKGLGYRHVQINKMILNTANCLGSTYDFIKICSVQLAGWLCGKHFKITHCTITDTNWVSSIFKLIDKVMSKFYMQACSLCSVKVHHTRSNIFRQFCNLWFKLHTNVCRTLMLSRPERYLHFREFNKCLSWTCTEWVPSGLLSSTVYWYWQLLKFCKWEWHH